MSSSIRASIAQGISKAEAQRRAMLAATALTETSDDARKEMVQKALAVGLSYPAAATRAGISAETLSSWLRNDGDFAVACGEAEAGFEMRAQGAVLRAIRGGELLQDTKTTYANGTTIEVKKYSEPDWRAAAWWLEKRRGNEYRATTPQVPEETAQESAVPEDLIAEAMAAIYGDAPDVEASGSTMETNLLIEGS